MIHYSKRRRRRRRRRRRGFSRTSNAGKKEYSSISFFVCVILLCWYLLRMKCKNIPYCRLVRSQEVHNKWEFPVSSFLGRSAFCFCGSNLLCTHITVKSAKHNIGFFMRGESWAQCNARGKKVAKSLKLLQHRCLQVLEKVVIIATVSLKRLLQLCWKATGGISEMQYLTQQNHNLASSCKMHLLRVYISSR